MTEALQIEREGTALIVRFARPEIRNPLSIAVVEQLCEVIDEVEYDVHIAAIIFAGTDSVFASGADLREIAEVTPATASEFAMRGQALMSKIAALPQTTIAAVNGFCFGGALDLALACDRRVASPNAQFAHPGAGLGIITGWGGTQRLPRLIGRGNAMEMFFTAEAIWAERAVAIGLIDEIAADPLARAREFVRGC